MAIRYKNPQTGEYEVIKIPVMKGEQGHAGIHVGTDAPPTTDVKLWFDPSDTDNDVDLANRLDTTLTACFDYMGNDRGSIKAAADANVDWLLGEVNTAHYEGQHITATETIEGHAKSAILKGQTLVNLAPDSVGGNGKINNQYSTIILLESSKLKPSTDYTFVIYNDSSENNALYTQHLFPFETFDVPAQSVVKMKTTTVSIFEQTKPAILSVWVNQTVEQNLRVMLLEGDYTNIDIPYFKGMSSVKMPTLHTVGKNLFDKNNYIETYGTGFYSSTIGIESVATGIGDTNNKWIVLKLPIGETYSVELDKRNTYPSGWSNAVVESDVNTIRTGGTYRTIAYASHNATKVTQQTFTTTKPYVFINVGYGSPYTQNKQEVLDSIMLNVGLNVLTYEPYKSNILTVNEEIVLGSVGNVIDTLDLLTGEVVKKTKEVVLNGSENGWNTYWNDNVVPLDNFFTCGINLDGKTRGGAVVDKFSRIELRDESEGFISNAGSDNEFAIRISKDKLETQDLKGFKKYLSQNPITVRYQLATESIKTVALSDNHVYSYKDVTHYDCSSEEGSLVPTLSIDVPTNLSALVTKQRQQIRTLEEENKELNQELQLAITSSEENDNELLAQSFELDFRLMEVECALDLPMAATFRLGGKTMAMTPYEMAKKLILADNYDRADMEHKLDVYVSKKRMTEAERQELIQLMDEKEGVITIDPVEPEVEESVIEHEAVTIPLH